jgi:DDE superfamily endonuclease
VLNTIEELRQFREAVYQTIERSRDAAFEVIDAIASSPNARSAAEVSESALMQRGFGSVYKALERMQLDVTALIKLLTRQADLHGTLEVAGYAIYALDHTPYPRKNAPTVADRGYVHGADGTVVGHQYSLLARIMHAVGAWVGVVDCARVPTARTPVQIGAEQIARLRENTKGKCIITADCEYLTKEILAQAHERTALLIRLKGNRTMYCAPPPRKKGARGPTRIHGRKVKLGDARTLGKPHAVHFVENPDGSTMEVVIFANMHPRTNPEVNGHLILVQAFRADCAPKFSRPIWLFWTGPLDMDWVTFWRVYMYRFCIESVHQFSKNSLAWTRARLGYTVREERWTWLVMLAYWQLLLTAPISQDQRRPWEKPMQPGRLPTPARVQRDYFRLFLLLGTPACPPRRRGNSPGRHPGYRPAPRPRYQTVYKGPDTS